MQPLHRLATGVTCLLLLSACGGGERAPATRGESSTAAGEPADPVARGNYLANFGGCHDCHTPKIFTATGPARDTSRLLSGHRAEAKLPPVPANALGPKGWGAVVNAELTAWAGPWGVSFTANLTPDATGLGGWTEDQFIQTMRTGKRLGVGRPILPPMPWQDIAKLTDEDLRALFAYLRSLKPVQNAVPAPIPPAAGSPPG